jgi:hypothetical protein
MTPKNGREIPEHEENDYHIPSLAGNNVTNHQEQQSIVT